MADMPSGHKTVVPVFRYTEVGQNNGNSTEILYTFLYQYGIEPPFAFNTAAILLGMDLYKF
jgi:hypothetical protein